MLLTLILPACGNTNRSDGEESVDLSPIDYRISSLENRVQELEGRVPSSTGATLKLGNSGFSVVDSTYGKLTIQLVSVRAEGSGSKVTFRIGNPLSTTLYDLSLVAAWGKVDEKGGPIFPAIKSDTLKLSGSLDAGSWNQKTVLIDGIKPNDFGYVLVTFISAERIALQG